MRILLAADHPLMLAGLHEVLEADPRFKIVGETMHASDVLPLVSQKVPDILLLDDRMPGLDCFACIDAIRRLRPEVNIVVLSGNGEPVDIETAFRCGACGVILKSIDSRDLVPALIQAVEGTAFHATGLPAVEGRRVKIEQDITPRERDILRGVSGGRSNRAIAVQLGISEATVKFHLSSIFRKLGLSNRTEAARWALAHGLQDPGDVRRAG